MSKGAVKGGFTRLHDMSVVDSAHVKPDDDVSAEVICPNIDQS